MLPGCRWEAFDERQGRLVGELLGKSRTHDIVDAVVVLGAIARGDRVVTSDPAKPLAGPDALVQKHVVPGPLALLNRVRGKAGRTRYEGIEE